MLFGCTNPTPRPADERLFPAPVRCNVHAHGAAYPQFCLPSPATIMREMTALHGGKLRLPTLDDVVTSLKRAVGAAKRIGENLLLIHGDTFANDLQLLIWNNTNGALVGDATGLRGSSTAGSFYTGLHTADPTSAGSQTSSEATFMGYARVGAARSSGGWTVSGRQASNTAAITFAQNTGIDQTVTHFSVGVASSSTSKFIVYGPLVASGATWLPFSAKTDDTITIPGNPFSVDDRIVLAAAYDGSLPTGITATTVYWVKTSSGNDITISTSSGGSALDITAVGSGVCIKAKPLVVRGGIDAVQFAAGTLVSKLG